MTTNGCKRAVTAALLLIGGCGCQAREDAMSQSIWIVTDDSAPQERCDYVLRGNECFAQVAQFPGYEIRKWYYCPELPDVVREIMKERVEMPSDISPPFPPGGVHFSRVRIEGVPPREGQRAFFRDNNSKVASWVAQLRQAAVRAEFEVSEELPELVSSNPAVKTQLGLRTKQER